MVNTVTDAAIIEITEFLFTTEDGLQKIPDGFQEKLKSYINRKLSTTGCCTIYIVENKELTKDFREFLKSFPNLNCEKRQVLINSYGEFTKKTDYRKGNSGKNYLPRKSLNLYQ